eukprot:185738-Prorocentrum_minimum.AAC.1
MLPQSRCRVQNAACCAAAYQPSIPTAHLAKRSLTDLCFLIRFGNYPIPSSSPKGISHPLSTTFMCARALLLRSSLAYSNIPSLFETNRAHLVQLMIRTGQLLPARFTYHSIDDRDILACICACLRTTMSKSMSS